ncbi:phosphatase PAP2 family protein [Azospirillum formosense]|uniref:phosphatase PAP2 family protein n=1 Tax=Azospirillum formosense TaxID=861533 RepID=UPI00338E9884
MTTAFDLVIIGWLNGYSRASVAADKSIYVIAQSDLLKGGVLMALLWWCWTRRSGRLIGPDLYAVRTIVGALLAIAIGRGMQNFLPMRLRPVHDPELGFVVPYDVNAWAVDGWSSFPSDHAVLFFALAAALWWSNRLVGAFAFLWTLVVICLPRVYLGLHFPTDILAGGVVGVLIMAAVLAVPVPERLARRVLGWQDTRPGIVYALAFLVTLQMATLFANARRLIEGAMTVLLGS